MLPLQASPHFWLILLACSSLATSQAGAQTNDAGGNDSAPTPHPVAMWHFDGADKLGKWQGQPKTDEPGPRPPAYPNFPTANRAAYFPGKDLQLTVADPGPEGGMRFGLGESITLEAWVRVKELKEGSYSYIVGKGRTRKGPGKDLNQNYALRLKGDKGLALATFLFASQPSGGKPGEWHRWTSTEGFIHGDGGWHHVAVSYTFGKPDSIHGYIDGKVVTGDWDMGGATERAPVQDADDLVIGTGNGGGVSNSFHGWLDDVAVWGEIVPENIMTARYQLVTPAARIDRTQLPRGQVLVELCEKGVPAANAWPPAPPTVTETYLEDVFGFFEVPQKYVETGVRGDRPIPYLLRATALVKLPAGKHRLLLRGRGAARLSLDGQVVLSTPFPPPTSDGHNPIPTKYLDLGPDFRFAPPGNREAWAPFTSAGGEHLVVLEMLVGSFAGKAKRRPELGETVVALSLGGSDTWQLLTPGARQIPYTDAGWAAYESERREHLAQVNAKRRAELLAQQNDYWAKRREAAKQWLAGTPEVPVPALPAGYPAHNAVDHFLSVKLDAAAKQQAQTKPGAVDFYKQVKPLLETRCLDCHQGKKVKGGLRLDALESARKGGDSGMRGVVPGKPDESELLVRISAADKGQRMPPRGEALKPEEIALLERWIREGASWPEFKVDSLKVMPLADDLAFLRRVTLDTVGVPPTLEEVRAFQADKAPDKRASVIERLLRDPRGADHWMGYWQDVLAENPNILNPTLNNTGPFRWWIYESLLDDKPMDLFVTELLRMKGSERFGGPAGFATASQNDVPMAAKGTVISTAFLGVEMKCARCHDAPYHESTQEHLFQLAALLAMKPLEVPKTSSVPQDKLHQGGRTPLIAVTLKPGTKVEPKWPFANLCNEKTADALVQYPGDPRDRIAALITAPQNERFAQVIANRVWKRLMGRGIVEPVDDWEKGKPTHPELLRWLGREFVRSGYSVKHLARQILNSHAYQRATDSSLREPGALYAAPAPRRLMAEQIVDSLFYAAGKGFHTEEVSLDVDGQRDLGNSLSLGQPTRSWMFASTSNERDRPSLSLPRVQAVVDVLAAFGWRPARPDPITLREEAPNILQPAVLANGVVSIWLTRLSDDHGVTQLAVRKNQSLDQLLDALFLRLLTRPPSAEERTLYTGHLARGFETRLKNPPAPGPRERKPPRYVSWSNHLSEEANEIKKELEAAARRGDPPTQRLDDDWRRRLEDVLWALLNSPEWVYAP